LDVIQASTQQKIAAIKQAQHDGYVSAHWEPAKLLTLILVISTTWLFVVPEAEESSVTEINARRRTVVDAVQLLVASSNRVGSES
jgi:hypothetical protein